MLERGGWENRFVAMKFNLFKPKPKTPKASKAPKAAKAQTAKSSRQSQRDAVKPVAPALAELFAQEPGPEPAIRGGVALPRFKATAADQVDRQRSDRFTTLRMNLRAAFTPSQPVVDRRMFAGRNPVLGAMIASIEDQKLHLVIYGPRGIGKTSLVHMLAEAGREARYIVHYSSCGAASNFQETFRGAAAEIPLLFHSAYGPTTEEAEAGSTFADLLPKGAFSPRQFGDLCAKLTGTRVLVVLDEFDRAEASDFRRELAELIKILSDRSVRVQLVIAGVAADIAELVEHIPSIRRNVLAVRVPLMDEEETREMIGMGERASGLMFDAPARDFLVRIACGWPYIASLICHHSGLAAIEAARTTVVAGDVSAALEGSLHELAGRIAKPTLLRVETLKDEGMSKLLTILAGAALRAGGEFELADIDAIAGKSADAAGAKRLVAQLASDRGLVRQQEEGFGVVYSFVEDGLPAYLWFQGAQDEFHAGQKETARASHG